MAPLFWCKNNIHQSTTRCFKGILRAHHQTISSPSYSGRSSTPLTYRRSRRLCFASGRTKQRSYFSSSLLPRVAIHGTRPNSPSGGTRLLTWFSASFIRLALKEYTSTDVNKILFAMGDHNDVTVTSGGKRKLLGLLTCHPLLLNSPFEEPPQIDHLLDDLLTEREAPTHGLLIQLGLWKIWGRQGLYLYRAHHVEEGGDHLLEEHLIQGRLAHLPCVSSGSPAGNKNQWLTCVHPNQGEPKSVLGSV